MKAIFLDIDGVLVTKRLLKQREGCKRVADADCVKALNRLLETSGAELVISSSWRFCGMGEMQAILDFWQVNAQISGMTPDLTTKEGNFYRAAPRGREIQAYLDANKEISNFVIIDDEADMVHLEPWLVKTKFESGLTETDADKALEIIGATTPTEGHPK